jgi:flagellar basal-body rod protein FlgC
VDRPIQSVEGYRDLINGVTSAALGAYRVQSARLSVAAHNVANVNTPGYRPASGHTPGALNTGTSNVTNPAVAADEALSATDLISESVNQLTQLQSLKASVAAFRTADEMTQTLLNLRA